MMGVRVCARGESRRAAQSTADARGQSTDACKPIEFARKATLRVSQRTGVKSSLHGCGINAADASSIE